MDLTPLRQTGNFSGGGAAIDNTANRNENQISSSYRRSVPAITTRLRTGKSISVATIVVISLREMKFIMRSEMTTFENRAVIDLPVPRTL
ncbi:MAG: hypothetical protein ABSG68_25575 [Thermoguttaceae bacterium]